MTLAAVVLGVAPAACDRAEVHPAGGNVGAAQGELPREWQGWLVSEVGTARRETREGHPRVVIGIAPRDGLRLTRTLDAGRVHELRVTAVDLAGHATLRLAPDNAQPLWRPAGQAARYLICGATSIEALIYQDAPFEIELVDANVHSHGALPRPVPHAHQGTLREELDPDLYLTAALDRIDVIGSTTLAVDGELLVIRHDDATLGGVVLAWSSESREAEPLPVIVDSVDGDVFIGHGGDGAPRLFESLHRGLISFQTAGDANLLENVIGNGESDALWIVGTGAFTLRLAAAGADTPSIESRLRRDRDAEVSGDDSMETVIWSRDRVHRLTQVNPGNAHGPNEYLLLRRGQFVALCGSMSALHQWMLRTLNIPARRVQFHGHGVLDGSSPDDTHLAVEAWIEEERRWVLSDPTFACFWTHDGADPDVPLDTRTLWGAVAAGHTPVPIFAKGSELPLHGRSPSEYPLPFAELFGAIDLTTVRIPGPLGERRIPRTRLGPPPGAPRADDLDN